MTTATDKAYVAAWGLHDFEVVMDGMQVCIVKSRNRQRLNPHTGRTDTYEPGAEEKQEGIERACRIAVALEACRGFETAAVRDVSLPSVLDALSAILLHAAALPQSDVSTKQHRRSIIELATGVVEKLRIGKP
jgi:hypothetical protein